MGHSLVTHSAHLTLQNGSEVYLRSRFLLLETGNYRKHEADPVFGSESQTETCQFWVNYYGELAYIGIPITVSNYTLFCLYIAAS